METFFYSMIVSVPESREVYLDLAPLCALGEHTEHESSEQLLMELAEADLLVGLWREAEACAGEGGDRGRAGRGEDRLPAEVVRGEDL